MDKHEQDDSRRANDTKHEPIDLIERRRRREVLANRIGFLLARRWLRTKRHGKRPAGQQKPTDPMSEKTDEDTLRWTRTVGCGW